MLTDYFPIRMAYARRGRPRLPAGDDPARVSRVRVLSRRKASGTVNLMGARLAPRRVWSLRLRLLASLAATALVCAAAVLATPAASFEDEQLLCAAEIVAAEPGEGDESGDEPTEEEGEAADEEVSEDDFVECDEGDDDIVTGPGEDEISTGVGNDRVDGGAGDDVVRAGAGNDRVDGGPGNDELEGGAGNDTLDGGPGDDELDGGAGDDVLDGGPGRDTISAGAGNDRIDARDGVRDVVDCGGGKDRTVAADPIDLLRNCELERPTLRVRVHQLNPVNNNLTGGMVLDPYRIPGDPEHGKGSSDIVCDITGGHRGRGECDSRREANARVRLYVIPYAASSVTRILGCDAVGGVSADRARWARGYYKYRPYESWRICSLTMRGNELVEVFFSTDVKK